MRVMCAAVCKPDNRRDYGRSQRAPARSSAPSFGGSRREDVADKLVNQLQGLVSALTYVSSVMFSRLLNISRDSR